jgi:1-acyl-sn-glycerol-3-phosphate acyltransferase
MDGFCWYARSMVRRQFFVFAVDEQDLTLESMDTRYPLIVYANHPGWWDPIVGMLLCRSYFPERDYFAPIDAEALRKYPIFRKLGYFGIQANSTSGAAEFLRQAAYILNQPKASLWITPEGKFTDPREDNPPFLPGVAHVVARSSPVHCLPLAIEYAFIDERQPLILCRFGRLLSNDGAQPLDKAQWHPRLVAEMRRNQAILADQIIRKDWSSFKTLLRSTSGSRSLGQILRRPWSILASQRRHQHGQSFS